jgi:hypothetical protein
MTAPPGRSTLSATGRDARQGKASRRRHARRQRRSWRIDERTDGDKSDHAAASDRTAWLRCSDRKHFRQAKDSPSTRGVNPLAT